MVHIIRHVWATLQKTFSVNGHRLPGLVGTKKDAWFATKSLLTLHNHAKLQVSRKQEICTLHTTAKSDANYSLERENTFEK
jgi:hypothetical protein